MDHTQNFSGLADQYTVGRPAYAEDFIHSMYKKYGITARSVIADVGAGTGKLSKQLLDKGSTVYSIEPNDDMRNIAIKELGMYEKFHAVNGRAEDTKMGDNTVDFITVAQAFHWFEPLRFQNECRRILRNKGLVFLIWNMRDMSDGANQKSFELFSKYCPKFKGFGGGIQQDDIRIKQFFNNQYEYIECNHPIIYNRNTFIRRCLSGSYSLRNGDAGYDNYVEELENLYEQYATDNRLIMKNKTIAYVGNIC